MAISRDNFNTFQSGEEYYARLQTEAERNFQILLSLLSSYWKSNVDGPNYAREMKAFAIELGRIRLSLEDIQQDVSYNLTRTEFLYQNLTSMLFSNESGYPDLRVSDVEFKNFLISMVKIFFQGSTPKSLQEAMELLTNSKVVIKENYKYTKENSTFDISDQFGFVVDVIINDINIFNQFLVNKNAKILLNMIKPAHTLYKIKYILSESYEGSLPPTENEPSIIKNQKIGDVLRWSMSSYSYDDFRKFVEGVNGVDDLGFKKPFQVTGEIHVF